MSQFDAFKKITFTEERYQQRLDDLLKRLEKLADRQARGLVYKKTWRAPRHVEAYDVGEHYAWVLMKPKTQPQRPGVRKVQKPRKRAAPRLRSVA